MSNYSYPGEYFSGGFTRSPTPDTDTDTDTDKRVYDFGGTALSSKVINNQLRGDGFKMTKREDKHRGANPFLPTSEKAKK